MFFKKDKYQPEIIKTPKITREELENMDTEELKRMYLDLFFKLEDKYSAMDYMSVWKDEYYGCKKWGEVKELAEEIKDIYNKRAGRYVFKVKINRTKNKVSYYYYGYKVDSLEGKKPKKIQNQSQK